MYTHTYMYTYIHTHIHIYMIIYIYICICIYIHTYVCTHDMMHSYVPYTSLPLIRTLRDPIQSSWPRQSQSADALALVATALLLTVCVWV